MAVFPLKQKSSEKKSSGTKSFNRNHLFAIGCPSVYISENFSMVPDIFK